MCILFIAINQHKNYPLIILANRDEFQKRPSSIAHFWNEHPNILAGKDEQDGGTWLGVSREGKISALTNYRNIPLYQKGRISRGFLVRDFLTSSIESREYLNQLTQNRDKYNPYNILIGNKEELFVYNNITTETNKLEDGFHGLSNAFLNSPWPKISKGIGELKYYILNNKIEKDDLFSIMKDESKAPDDLLPDTGVGIEGEKLLSSIFINNKIYGTRSTAILLFDNSNKLNFYERTYTDNAEIKNDFHTLLEFK